VKEKKLVVSHSLNFLIASRVDPANATDIDFKSEDASFILLGVMDSAPLPQDKEAERIRVETAQRVKCYRSGNYYSFFSYILYHYI